MRHLQPSNKNDNNENTDSNIGNIHIIIFRTDKLLFNFHRALRNEKIKDC